MKNLIFALCVCCTFLANAQHKQDYVWLLGIDRSSNEPGSQAFRFDFNGGILDKQLANNGLWFDNNNASICDGEGSLLFFTNGCAVLNREASVMPEGDSLNHDLYMEISGWDNCEYGYLGFQDIIILPDPAYQNGYYIVHKPLTLVELGATIRIDIQTTYVDMALDGGLGDVVYKNVSIYDNDDPLSSYLTAIANADGSGYWLIQPIENDSVFLTYLIDGEGIHRLPDQNSHQYFTRFRSSASGTAKFSPDGNKYALYNYYDQLHVYDFDRETGLLSNHREIVTHDEIDVDEIRYSSVEWSPNSRFIYTASTYQLHQVDMWEVEPQDGVQLIANFNGTEDPFPTVFFLMAQGPDCRIYMCPTSSTNSYHVIHNPDGLGQDCDFVQNGIELPLTTGVGSFPNFPRFRVDEEEKCDPAISSVFGNAVYFRRGLEVFPNPSSGRFTVRLPEGLVRGSLRVTGLNGRALLQREIQSGSAIEAVDLSWLPAGQYNIAVHPQGTAERVYYSSWVVKIR